MLYELQPAAFLMSTLIGTAIIAGIATAVRQASNNKKQPAIGLKKSRGERLGLNVGLPHKSRGISHPIRVLLHV